MSDLISRQLVKNTIRAYFASLIEKGIHEIDVVDCNAELHKEIEGIPIKYDINKVLDELDEAYNKGILGDYRRIVKGGGRGE